MLRLLIARSAMLLVLAGGLLFGATANAAELHSRQAAAHPASRVAAPQHGHRRLRDGHLVRARHHHHHQPRFKVAEHSLKPKTEAPPVRSADGRDARRWSTCRERADASACADLAAAEDALYRANRRAFTAGVPLAILRVGYDRWAQERDRSAAESDEALLHAYEERIAFAERTITAKRDWRFASRLAENSPGEPSGVG